MAPAKGRPKEKEGQSKRRNVAIADTGSVDGRADEDRQCKRKKKKEVRIRT